MPTSAMAKPDDRAITFGPFSVYPARQLLLKEGRRVPIGSRAFGLLIALLEHAGEPVPKDRLIARAWPNRVVEDSNLRVQVALLRKALDDRRDGNEYVVAVPGHGYRFAPATTCTEARHAGFGTDVRTNNLPLRLNPVIGRDDVVDILAARLRRQRLVTVVGTGGVGKTTVAVAAATALLASYRDGVWLMDLAPIADATLLPCVLATTIGLPLTSHDPMAELLSVLRDKHILLVFDNCERVIEAATILVEAIIKGAPSATILATSREPLRAEGESVHRLSPLQIPPATPGLTAASALHYSSVALFVERVASSMDGFRLSDGDAPVAADICRQLDGIALAIELAAARVGAFGMRGVAERLGDRFRILVGARRTALPRHQTLLATLDWSHALLAEEQRALLRRLGVFAGGFTLESACRVAADKQLSASTIPDLLGNLVEKSLVALEAGGRLARYRLLDTTRAYASAKLAETSEFSDVQRRHAECFRDLLARSLAEWKSHLPEEWLGRYRPEIDNVRLALDWAFSPAGDIAIGISMTVAAIPLWFRLSSTEECRSRVGHALAKAGATASGTLHARNVMQLYAALGLSQTFTIGLAPQASAAWAKALDIAHSLADQEFRLEALWGLWLCHIGLGEYRLALDAAREFRKNSESPYDRALGDRLIGVPLHCLGHGAEARRHIASSLRRNAASVESSTSIRFRFNQPLAARAMLAQMLWLEGSPEQAMEEAHLCVREARLGGHAISVCDALALAQCPLAMFTGEWSLAEQAIVELLDEADRAALVPWEILGQCWSAAVQVKRGEFDPGLTRLADGLNNLRQVRFALFHAGFLATLAEGLAMAGRFAQGLRAIDEALQLCARREDLWCVAELLRVKGEIVLQGADPRLADAESLFNRSLTHARRQRALSWELRAVTSIARLRCRQGRPTEARAGLAATYVRFREGFATGDLRAAKTLMDELS